MFLIEAVVALLEDERGGNEYLGRHSTHCLKTKQTSNKTLILIKKIKI